MKLGVRAVVVAAALSVAALTGCSADLPTETVASEPAPAVEALVATPEHVEAPEPEPVDDTAQRELVFDIMMLEEFDASSLEDVRNIAQNFCQSVDLTGDFSKSAQDYFLLSLDSGVDVNSAAVILGAGVMTYCPEYELDMNIWSASF